MPVTIRIYEIADTGPVKTRRSSYFGIKDPWSSLFKPLAEFTVPRGLYSCAILDKFLVLLGADGFMFVAINNRSALLSGCCDCANSSLAGQIYDL